MFLNLPYTVSTFTPDNAIVVTRLQAQLGIAPLNCTQNAMLQITDGTTSGTATLPLTALANDSGTVSLNYAAGVAIHVAVSTPASCKNGTAPSLANLVVQYHAQ